MKRFDGIYANPMWYKRHSRPKWLIAKLREKINGTASTANRTK